MSEEPDYSWYGRFARAEGEIKFKFTGPSTLMVIATARDHVAEHTATVRDQIDLVRAIDQVIQNWAEVTPP